MEIKIDKNIPIPEKRTRNRTAFRKALEKMEVGDSFEFSSPNYPKKDPLRSIANHVQVVSNNQKKFRTQSIGGVQRRVWRIK